MSSKPKKSEHSDSLGLDAFKRPVEQEGLPLDELQKALASTLSRGGDPYTPAEESAQLSELGGLSGESEMGCELSPRSILEAILFVGNPDNSPITSEAVASLMRGVRPAEVDDLVRELNEEYLASGRPYWIESHGAGYRLSLREEFNGVREKFRGRIRQTRLSAAAVETLSLVAYNQPVTAETITKLRGVTSDSLLAQLVRRGLLRIERSEEGRAKNQYYTTDRFLQVFGIDSIDDLPRALEPEAPAS